MQYRALTVAFALALIVACSTGTVDEPAPEASPPISQANGLQAWEQVYSVLTHPRCINCHTAVDYPQQGDDRHRHLFHVVRGPEGKGVAGLNCGTCHQEENNDTVGIPGGHNWHLAPLSMAWQTLDDRPLSSASLCRVLIDRSKNFDMDGPALLKHHETEPLVHWAWNPGRALDGTTRTPPPMSHAQFVDATRRWVEAGTPCP